MALTSAAFNGFFDMLGEARSRTIVFVATSLTHDERGRLRQLLRINLALRRSVFS
jgi:hypothetical protein